MTGLTKAGRLPVLLFAASVFTAGPAAAQDAEPSLAEDAAADIVPASVPLNTTPTIHTVTPDVIRSLREFIDTEIVRQSIVNQNGTLSTQPANIE